MLYWLFLQGEEGEPAWPTVRQFGRVVLMVVPFFIALGYVASR